MAGAPATTRTARPGSSAAPCTSSGRRSGTTQPGGAWTRPGNRSCHSPRTPRSAWPTGAESEEAAMKRELRVDPTACSGHGLCAELLPELITLDEWGYPIVARGPVPRSLDRHVRRAVTDCPVLALKLLPAS